MSRPPSGEATRRRVLRRAEEIGVGAAAREAGLRPETVSMWRTRARRAAAVAEETPSERKERAALEAWDAAQAALAKVREMLGEGKTLDAQRAALAFAILVDKSHLLNEQARAGLTSDEWTLGEIDAAIARLSAELPAIEPARLLPPPVIEGSLVESPGREGSSAPPSAAPDAEGAQAEPAADDAQAPAPAKRRLGKLRWKPESATPIEAPLPRDAVAELHWDETHDVWRPA